MRRLAALALAALLCPALATAATRAEPKPAPDQAAVLELRGQHRDVRCPDILFLAPLPNAPAAAYAKALAPAEAAGFTLPNASLPAADFHSAGPLPILKAAGYRLRRVRGIPWQEACARIAAMMALRHKTRVEDGLELDPLCVFLEAEASPADLAASLPALLGADALLILAPQRAEGLPLIVAWRDVIWPGHRDARAIRPEHWVPTVADVVGLPPPAESGAVSLFPLLTSVGHQRPLEPPPAAEPPATGARAYTMLSRFENLPEDCPWVPDFTDAGALRPVEWAFLPAPLPLPAAAAEGLAPADAPQGFYARALQASLDLAFPPGVSAVVRVNACPVFSVWQPTEETHWRLASSVPLPIEVFVVVPAGVDPATLPLFLQPTPETTPQTE